VPAVSRRGVAHAVIRTAAPAEGRERPERERGSVPGQGAPDGTIQMSGNDADHRGPWRRERRI
jgi:hypothetical protein